MISFNVPPYVGTEEQHIAEAIASRKICGDGMFTKRCNAWIEEETGTAKALLTTSCTHATEMAALLADIRPGDEVIMPSYTFVSTADAFVLRGATAVFVDIRPDTMNIDETLIEDAITEKTRAIVPVHYAGVSCEMDVIMENTAAVGSIMINSDGKEFFNYINLSLAELIEDDKVSLEDMVGSKLFSAAFRSRHSICGKLIHMHCDELNEIKEHLFSHHGFNINSMRTVFYGVCKDCSK